MDRTRLLVSVFVIISYAAPCYSWDPNNVYLYDYAASVTTGSASSNIVVVEGQLIVNVVNARQLIFRLNGANVTGSRDLEWSTSSWQELEIEFHVDLQNNTVQSLVYPSCSNVSQWVVSVHKGIASLFSLRYPEPKEGRVSSSTTYTSMEEEVTGTCANVYDWTPLDGEGNVGNRVNAMCHPTLRNRYQLFKTRDFDNCTHLPIYNLVAPAGWRCKPGSAICENVQSRSLVERVELCGDLTGRKMDILEIELREDWISQPWGAKHHQPTPHRMSITQRLILTAKDKSQVDRSRGREEEDDAQHESTGRYRRQSLGYTFGQMETNLVLDDKTIEQFLDEIKELRSILFQPAELVKRRGSTLRRRLFHHFRSLSPLQLASLTERARRQLTPHIWSFYVQQMATVGSSATLDLVKQLMEREEITNEDIMGLISGFSMFLREPSDHVLGQLLSLLDLKVVRSEPDLRQTAMVSLASFFRMACIDRLSAKSRFPSQYLNTSREEVWPQRLVARLAVEIRQGESGDRSAALSALNILGHPSLIPVVIPLIEGKGDSNPAVRTKAVLALHKLAHHGDPSAIKILHMVYANPSDNYQVRLAAFTLLMLSCPPDHVWQSVAARTWFEPRSHVASFVFTTFDTLATFRSPLRFLQKLSLKAKKVLKLTKPVIRGRSANYIWSYEKRRRLLASYLRLETFANKASVFPKETYGRLNFNLGAVDFDFLEFEIQGHHMESILAHLLGPEDSKECQQGTWSAPVDALLARMNVTYPIGQLGEGFFHWTLMESIEKFWSFDGVIAKRIRGYLGGDSMSWPSIVWLHQLPLANVEIRWANSMGFVTQVLVTGHITASVNGSLDSSQPMTIDSHLNPTVALEVESSIGVELSGIRVGTSSSSSVLLLASLPGRILVRSSSGSNRMEVKWSIDSGAGKELIALHKSHCLDGLCPEEEISQVEWPKMFDKMGEPIDWRKLVSVVSFSWLPDENMKVGWRQFSWPPNSIRPTVFQFSVQLNKKSGKPSEWVMTSGSTDLRQTSPSIGSSQGGMELPSFAIDSIEKEVTEGKASRGDPSDFIGTLSDVEERVKRIGLSAAAAGPSSFSLRATAASWLELPTQIGWALANAQTLTAWGEEDKQLEADHLAIEWKWTGDLDVSDSTGYRKFIIENNTTAQYYPGSCRIGRNLVNTFDGVEYDPGLMDECQYMVMAATGTENKLAILLDRGSSDRNQVLKLIMSEDTIEIDLDVKRLVVNRVSIPLPVDNISQNNGFSLVTPCRRHSPLLYASTSSDALHVELPIHGLILDIRSENDILIKAKESLGGQLQGLCGDMNGERLFEFRGPDRCVLSSGSLMAAQYQTSQRSHCTRQQQQHLPASSLSTGAERIPLNRRHQTPSSCPRQEGSPTAIKMPADDLRRLY